MTTVTDVIRDRLLATIEATGNVPWQKHWNANGISGPVNIDSKKHYTGVNIVLLGGCNGKPVFGTSKQWNALKCEFVEQPKPYACVYYGTKFNKLSDDEKKKGVKPKSTGRFLKYYTVYSEQDVILSAKALEIVNVLSEEKSMFDGESNYCTIGEMVINKLKIELRYGNPACGKGYICMPCFSEFNSEYEYLCSLTHEITHYYARELDLNTNSYAINELIAEIGSVFIVNSLGIAISDDELVNNAAYVAGWKQKLKTETDAVNEIMKASSTAQRITNHVMEALA